MKIKIFQAGSEKKLEKNVNDFIAQDSVKVLELQYSSSFGGLSVMIVYEERENNAY